MVMRIEESLYRCSENTEAVEAEGVPAVSRSSAALSEKGKATAPAQLPGAASTRAERRDTIPVSTQAMPSPYLASSAAPKHLISISKAPVLSTKCTFRTNKTGFQEERNEKLCCFQSVMLFQPKVGRINNSKTLQ